MLFSHLEQILGPAVSLHSKHIFPLCVVRRHLDLGLHQLQRLLLVLEVIERHLLVFVHVENFRLEDSVDCLPGSIVGFPAVKTSYLAGEISFFDFLFLLLCRRLFRLFGLFGLRDIPVLVKILGNSNTPHLNCSRVWRLWCYSLWWLLHLIWVVFITKYGF